MPAPAPHTPAIAGSAQVIQRDESFTDASSLLDRRGPIELMVEACRAAAADAGAASLLAVVDWIAVAGGYWRFANPGQLIADRIGSPGAETGLAAMSGSAPQEMVGIAAARIAAGEIDVALVVGGEARWTSQRLKRAGLQPTWLSDPGEGRPETLSGFDPAMMEEAGALGAPATSYVLFDDSLRVARGVTVEDHRHEIADLWASFAAVAAANPYAWDRSGPPADAIREPSPDNRMIAYPYTKAMVANNTVDLASATLLCSVEAAERAGVTRDRLVFPHVVTTSHETWRVANRHRLHGSPALATAGREAFARAGIGPDDVTHVDLYACFPAIVQMSAAALGLGLDRPLTLTGGLGFAGAPVANAAGQSIAAMVPLVRGGGWGLVHANGGNATKHAFGIYSNQPPAAPYDLVDCNDRVDHRAREALPGGWSGDAEVEAATAVYGREGPTNVFAAVLDADGRRGWATSTDTGLIERVLTTGLAGAKVHRDPKGAIDDVL